MSQWHQVVSMPRYMNQITACKTNGVIFLLGMCEPLAGMLCSEVPEGCGPVGQGPMESNKNDQWSGKHDLRGTSVRAGTV